MNNGINHWFPMVRRWAKSDLKPHDIFCVLEFPLVTNSCRISSIHSMFTIVQLNFTSKHSGFHIKCFSWIDCLMLTNIFWFYNVSIATLQFQLSGEKWKTYRNRWFLLPAIGLVLFGTVDFPFHPMKYDGFWCGWTELDRKMMFHIMSYQHWLKSTSSIQK